MIGIALDIPEHNASIKFHEWGKVYGPIYETPIAGRNHVWICTDAIAKELLSKHSGIFSDRPHIPALAQDNRTSGQYLPLMSINGQQTQLPAWQRKY